MDKPRKITDILLNLDLYLSCLMLAVLIVVTISGVAMRYVANRPFHWIEEVQLMCFVWVVFLGACAVARRGGHIGIDAIVTLFPLALQKLAGLLAHVAAIVTLGFLGFYSCLHVSQMYTRDRLTSILGIPYALIYLVVPISCLIMILTAIKMVCQGRLVKPKEDYA